MGTTNCGPLIDAISGSTFFTSTARWPWSFTKYPMSSKNCFEGTLSGHSSIFLFTASTMRGKFALMEIRIVCSDNGAPSRAVKNTARPLLRSPSVTAALSLRALKNGRRAAARQWPGKKMRRRRPRNANDKIPALANSESSAGCNALAPNHEMEDCANSIRGGKIAFYKISKRKTNQHKTSAIRLFSATVPCFSRRIHRAEFRTHSKSFPS